jgi:UDP-2,4-diacetamido-2,4,6-trideoxy-beta-L-altropyranose hydrolase
MNPLRVIFRTDASVQIGSGHVMRCLTLADALTERGGECQFICREHEGNLLEYIRQRGFATYGIPVQSDDSVLAAKKEGDNSNNIPRLGADWATDAAQSRVGAGETAVDWLIVDHYKLDARWERELRPLCYQLMVIDDLADRPHDCDLLLDQNYYCNQNQRYQGLLPEHCVSILGPGYVLLRQEFHARRQQLRMRNGTIERILVFFGGSDPTNQTEIVLKALEQLNRPELSVDVVVGPTNPNRESIRTICDRIPCATYHCNVSNMAELIAKADLGIGAGGSAMWERCYLGLPTITVVFADNQLRTTEDVAGLGAIEYLGWSDSLATEDYARAVLDAIVNPQRVKQISDAACRVVTGGSTSAVVNAMRNFEMPNLTKLSAGSLAMTASA